MTGPLGVAHDTAAVIGTAATLRRTVLMFKSGFDVAVKVFTITALVVSAIEAGPTADGATKKQQATEKIQGEINKALPAWAVPVVDPMIGFLVDAGVSYANTSGIFTKSAAA